MSLEQLSQQLQASVQRSAPELAGQVASVSQQEGGPSRGRQFQAGFSHGTNIVGNVLRTFEARSPETAEAIYNVLPGFKEKENLEELYGEGFNNPHLPDSVRREVIKQHRQRQYELAYGDVEQSGFWYGLGEVGAAAADPTIAVPFAGQARLGMVGAAAVNSALWAGADTAIRGVAEEGAASAVSVAIAAGLGAGAGAALQKFIVGPIAKYVGGKADSGSKVTSEELQDIALQTTKGTDMESELGRLDFSKMAEDLNSSILTKSPEQAFTASQIQVDFGQRLDPFDYRVAAYKGGKVDEFIARGTDATPPTNPFKAPLKEQMDKYKDIQRRLRSAPTGSEGAYNKFLVDTYKKAYPTPKNPAMAEAFTKAFERDLGKSIDSVIETVALKQSDELDAAFERIWQEVPMETVGAQIIADASKITLPSGQPKYNPSNITPEMVADVIYSRDVPYGSTTGDLLSPSIGTRPIDLNNLPPAEDMRKTWVNWAHGAVMVKPRTAMESFGPAGKMLSESMQAAEANKLQRVGQTLTHLSKMLDERGIKPGTPLSHMVSDVVHRTVSRGEAPRIVREVASEIEKFYSKTLKELLDAKLIKKEEYDFLSKRAREEGYMTRVYDERFLQTKKGREEWANELSKVVFTSEAGAKAAIRSILGEKSEWAKKVLDNHVRVDDQGRRRITAEGWGLVAKNRSSVTPSRSKYLDNERNIPNEFNKAISKFLVKDPLQVIANYSEDIFTRLEYGKIFGKDDELAFGLINQIGKVSDQTVTDRLTQTYFDSVRDPRSQNIQSFVKASSLARSIGGGLRAFEVLRLGTASVLNLGQPIINGTTKLQASQALGSPEALAISIKGIINGYRSTFGNKALKEEAMRSGAANQIMVMNHMGQLGEAYHRIFPWDAKFLGTFNPYNVLNNPQAFLRVSGFFKAEEIARSVGYFQGKAYLESLMAKKAKFNQLGNRANPKSVKKVDDALRELGVDPTIPMDQVTVDIAERAGQYFSNSINFLNSAIEMPLAWNSFYGKIATQFKSFSMHTGSFVAKNVIEPAKRGNLMPLMTFAGPMVAAVGMPLDAFRRMIMQDDREFTTTEAYFRGLFMVGGLGLIMDGLDRAANSPTGLLEVVAGPAAGDISRAAYGVSASAKKSLEEGELNLDPMASQLPALIPYGRTFMKETQAMKMEMDKHYGNQFRSF